MDKVISAYAVPGIQIAKIKIPYTKRDLYKIMDKLCEIYQVDFFELTSKSRGSELVYVRQLFCYFMKERFINITLSTTTETLDKDHTTVMYSIKEFSRRYEHNELVPGKVKSEYRTTREDYEHTYSLLTS